MQIPCSAIASSGSFCEVHCIDYHLLPLLSPLDDHHHHEDHDEGGDDDNNRYDDNIEDTDCGQHTHSDADNKDDFIELGPGVFCHHWYPFQLKHGVVGIII